MNTSNLRRRVPEVWTLCAALSLFGLMVHQGTSRIFVQGDTVAVIDGAQAIQRCIAERQWTGCEGVHQFALFQYALAVALAYCGASATVVGKTLAVISLPAMIGTLLLLWLLLRRRGPGMGAYAAVASVLGSYIIWYAQVTSTR